MRTRLTFALLSCALAASASAKTDWNRFRGPNGTGYVESRGLPDKIDESSTVWKVELPKGWSSPALWEDKIVVTAEEGAGKRAVICLNAADGSKLWQFDVSFAEHRQNKLNSFASSTPFVDETRIYITWTSATNVEALALDHQGNLLWRNDHVADYIHEHGSGCSPVVADGVLIVRAEFDVSKNGQQLALPEQMDWKSHIIGLDAATGKEKWKLSVPNTLNPYSTPMVRDAGSGKHEFVVANTTSGLMGIDTTTGKINWQHNPGYRQRSVASVIIKDDVLFAPFGSGDGGKESALVKLGGGKPKEVGSIIKNIPYVPTPILIGDRLFMLRDGGFFTCVKWPSGEELYSERLPGAGGRSGRYFSSPVAADGKVYCSAQTGDVVVMKAGDKFEVVSVNTLDSPINATPAIGDGRIYFRTEKSLWCVGAKSPVP